jgi:N-acylglucosamine 2-epimerase
MTQNFLELPQLYRDTLPNNIIPFWMQHSIDHTNGGYFTCLDRQGQVYELPDTSSLKA